MLDPTPAATFAPTTEPTVIPTQTPTIKPTATATGTAISAPTVTTVPELVATAEPTTIPTLQPTSVPTVLPTDVPTIEPTVPPTRVPTARPTETPGVGTTPEPTARSTESPPSQPTAISTEAPATEAAPEPTAMPTLGATEPDDGETVTRQMSFSVSLPGVDLPDAAQLCLENADFDGCAPLVPGSVASVHPGLLIQATSTYTATFTDLPEGTYTLTIPSIGSFPGYSTRITIDREMSSVITIDIPDVPSLPGGPAIPDGLAPPDEPRDQGPPFAAPIPVNPPLPEQPGVGGIAGSLPGDGTSGNVDDGKTQPRLADHPADVTMLPSTGTGGGTRPGLIPLGALLTFAVLMLLAALRAGHRESR
ncbi:MAG: hypothetical protein AVDCRST_MAG87-3045 [uncultured Thermomicrobiales bacterium]|uniref:Uncharacterized protein n=1 Tax=uncultured Thermomicrobiales bacterium TaxID=1645740 RepID=A0A6J4VHB7_9BACT|nr:MAG: hypothetical protein AVDCRST_MAG87-3045 [uncultured Thermomicrobiales bacterium]